MKVVSKDSEEKLVEVVGGLKEEPSGYYALHFNLSHLEEQYRSEYQIKIAVNILHDLFKAQDSLAFITADSDVILLYNGTNRALLEKCIFQLRYLFMDDPLAYNADGFENEDFCAVYDLEFQWRDFFRSCQKKAGHEQLIEKHAPSQEITTTSGKRAKMHLFTPESLVKILATLQKTNISAALRNQPVCAVTKGQDKPKVIFDETYVNISHLADILKIDVDLSSSMTLFKHLTKTLDKRVLVNLRDKIKKNKNVAVSLNLNVRSLFSEDFAAFDVELTEAQKSSIILELQISDVFEDISRFLMAKDAVQRLGYRICLDGLDSFSFAQVDRKSLGFDLAKVQWHPELATDEGRKKQEQLTEAVKRCDPKRVILCRCDNIDAINYGQSIGISLFQGWHLDKMLNPEFAVVN